MSAESDLAAVREAVERKRALLAERRARAKELEASVARLAEEVAALEAARERARSERRRSGRAAGARDVATEVSAWMQGVEPSCETERLFLARMAECVACPPSALRDAGAEGQA